MNIYHLSTSFVIKASAERSEEITKSIRELLEQHVEVWDWKLVEEVVPERLDDA